MNNEDIKAMIKMRDLKLLQNKYPFVFLILELKDEDIYKFKDYHHNSFSSRIHALTPLEFNWTIKTAEDTFSLQDIKDDIPCIAFLHERNTSRYPKYIAFIVKFNFTENIGDDIKKFLKIKKDDITYFDMKCIVPKYDKENNVHYKGNIEFTKDNFVEVETSLDAFCIIHNCYEVDKSIFN